MGIIQKVKKIPKKLEKNQIWGTIIKSRNEVDE
ncbi:hypothetical protein IUSA1_00295 [Streptococcus iniae IUSA1]|nr:hypothetical protein IUSA1_00295 [Streptococcus iniae IUSA1]